MVEHNKNNRYQDLIRNIWFGLIGSYIHAPGISPSSYPHYPKDELNSVYNVDLSSAHKESEVSKAEVD